MFYFCMSVYSSFATAFVCEMAQPHIDRSVQLTGSISIKLSKLEQGLGQISNHFINIPLW